MKILHVTPFFHPAYTYGGPIPVLYELCCESVRAGCYVNVLTTNANGPKPLDVATSRDEEIADHLFARYCRRVAGESISPALLALLPRYIKRADVVHLSCVYSFPTIPTLVMCRLLSKPLIWSPMGALQRWTGSRRLRLKAQWELICRAVRPSEFLIHVTSDAEAAETAKIFPTARLAVVPHGVHLPKVRERAPSSTLRLLFMGRLHPKKGVENLLEACAHLRQSWGALRGRFNDWRLTVAGAGAESYAAELHARIANLGLSSRVTMAGEVAGEVKEEVFVNSDILVVPSFTENFAMVVVEALARGLPVIASTGTPWSRLEQISCGLWVKNDPLTLASAVTSMSRMPLEEMGGRARRWMAEEFSWPAVTNEMLALYRDSIKGSHSPERLPPTLMPGRGRATS